jgi:hypothetical protein
LLDLERKGVPKDDQQFQSAYRSFEGEVFENFVYEKLLRYAKEHDAIEKFIVKGPHKRKTHALPNTLSVNGKGQIVYRTRQNEIGEFDGLIFTKKQLYFVEMTLVKSVTNLKRRLRKKKALLETIFPQYEVRALLVLNEGVTGTRELPSYCTVWITKPFSAEKVYEWMKRSGRQRRKRFYQVRHKKIVGTGRLNIANFKYYNTLTWVLKSLRSDKQRVIDMDFFGKPVFTRYHDLFTKVYIGYMKTEEFRAMYPQMTKETTAEKVFVAIEKEHTGVSFLTYFLPHSRKKLDNIVVKNDEVKIVKKDPYGITVTEIAHMSRVMDHSHRLRADDIRAIEDELSRL